MTLIPSLTLLAAQKVADCLEKSTFLFKSPALHPGCLPMTVSALPATLTDLVLRLHQEKHGELTEPQWEVVYQSGIFAASRLDTSGIPLTSMDLKTIKRNHYTSFKLGYGEPMEEDEHDQVSESTFMRSVLNKRCRQQLKVLDLSGSRDISRFWPSRLLPRLPNLCTLILANRPISKRVLKEVSVRCPQLKCLDISCTGITDISSLAAFERLEVLITHDLHVESGFDALKALSNLRVLDVSVIDVSEASLAEYVLRKSRKALQKRKASPWPQLRSLDLGGSKMTSENIKKVIDAHPKLQELLAYGSHLEELNLRPGLKVLSPIEMAARYMATDRPIFVHDLLREIFFRATMMDAPMSRSEVVELLRLAQQVILKHAGDREMVYQAVMGINHLLVNWKGNKVSVSQVQTTADLLSKLAEHPDYSTPTEIAEIIQYWIWESLSKRDIIEAIEDSLEIARLAARILLKPWCTGLSMNVLLLKDVMLGRPA
ncbi:unnamed protein product [Caenorhabditis sp. 36 PRJEB53466]|nr:unnamed protein product [Caenorhabditis sp. 36 PRJEB53466]